MRNNQKSEKNKEAKAFAEKCNIERLAERLPYLKISENDKRISIIEEEKLSKKGLLALATRFGIPSSEISNKKKADIIIIIAKNVKPAAVIYDPKDCYKADPFPGLSVMYPNQSKKGDATMRNNQTNEDIAKLIKEATEAVANAKAQLEEATKRLDYVMMLVNKPDAEPAKVESTPEPAKVESTPEPAKVESTPEPILESPTAEETKQDIETAVKKAVKKSLRTSKLEENIQELAETLQKEDSCEKAKERILHLKKTELVSLLGALGVTTRGLSGKSKDDVIECVVEQACGYRLRGETIREQVKREYKERIYN